MKRPPQERWVNVVAEGSQVANLLFTVALYADVSRRARERRLCASITVALLRSVSCNYIVSQASEPGGQASSLLPWIAPNVSRRCYGSHNLIPNFCHAAKSPVARQTRSLNELTPQSGRRRTNLLFCSHVEGLKIRKRPKMLSPSEGGASRWHKAQNGRSLRSILSGTQNQDGAASSPMSLKWVWVLEKMPNGLMDISTTASSPRGGCGKWWVLVHTQGFGAQMLLSQVFSNHLYAGMCSWQDVLHNSGGKTC